MIPPDINTTAPSTKKPGLVRRLVDKLDASLKKKAEASASEGSCCGGSGKKGKGGKCC